MRGVGVVLVFAALLTGCGHAPPGRQAVASRPPQGPVDAPPPSDRAHEAALAAWRGFPASRVPRPLVLPYSTAAGGGFTADGAKEAALAGRFELAVAPPAGPATVAVRPPDGPVTYPAITAQAAFDAMVAEAGQEAVSTAAPVRVTGVELGTALFHTDRGEVELPAWRFGGPGIAGAISWPALTPDALWPWRRIELSADRRVQLPLRQAMVSPDGRLLTVILWQPKPPCGGRPTYRHDPVVTEDAGVVVVGMTRVVVSQSGPRGTPCTED